MGNKIVANMQAGELGRQGPVPVTVVVVVMMAIARSIHPLESVFLLSTEHSTLVGAHFGFVERGAQRCTLGPLCCLGTSGYGLEE